MKKALKDLFIYILAGGLSRLLPVLILPYVAVKMGQQDFGLFSLFQLYLSLFSTMAMLGLEQAVFRKIPSANSPLKNQLMGTALYWLLFSGLIITIAALMFSDPLNQILFTGKLIRPVWLVALFSVIVTADMLFITGLKAEKRTAFYIRLMLTRSMLFFVLILLLLEWDFGLDAYFLALLISEGIALVMMRVELWKELQAGFSFPLFRKMLQYGLPLSATALILLLIYQFDHYLITSLFGVETTGRYAFAYKFAAIIGALTILVNNVYLPRLFEKGTDFNRKYLRDYAALLLAVSSGIILLLISVFRSAGAVLIPSGYEGALYLIAILGLGYLFYAHVQVLDSVMLQNGKTGILFLFNLLALAINIILNLVYLPRYGLPAAAWITASSYAALWLAIILYLLWQHRTLPIPAIIVEGLLIILPVVLYLVEIDLVWCWIVYLPILAVMFFRSQTIWAEINRLILKRK